MEVLLHIALRTWSALNIVHAAGEAPVTFFQSQTSIPEKR